MCLQWLKGRFYDGKGLFGEFLDAGLERGRGLCFSGMFVSCAFKAEGEWGWVCGCGEVLC
jgi:hypothetical protein